MTMQGGVLQGGAAQDSARTSRAWIGFLVMAFVVIGLMGGIATFAAQIPFERALARNAALDEVLQAAGSPDSAAKLEALRPALGDSADHVLGSTGDIAAKVAAERGRMWVAFGQDARDTGMRLRLVLAIFTAAGAVFGAAVLSIVRGAAPDWALWTASLRKAADFFREIAAKLAGRAIDDQ